MKDKRIHPKIHHPDKKTIGTLNPEAFLNPIFNPKKKTKRI
jgi:hypothetical protein